MEINKKEHWETIYKTKELKEVSWYQPVPQTSLDLLKKHNIPLDAKIIDIGGGDSFLADNLLKLGYSDITVLDISEEAILKAQRRLGDDAKKINWIVSDVTDFRPEVKYDFWHDRAAFHFLTAEKDITQYKEIAKQGISKNGILAIGTFSKNGPLKCSGIEIKQYSEQSLEEQFNPDFKLIDKFTVDHNTPFGTVQNFVFGIFLKAIE